MSKIKGFSAEKIEKESKEKSKYFGFKKDFEDFKYENGWGKLRKSGKMLAKGIANVGIFTVTEVIPKIPEVIEKQKNNMEKQREKEK